MGQMTRIDRVDASTAKYIKLGKGGAWEGLCFEDGTLRLGYNYVPHEVALVQDRERIRQFFLDRDDPPQTAANHANQVFDFYHAEPETLWITIADGFLWWCFAKPGIEHLGVNGSGPTPSGTRLRRTVDGWHNTSLGGRPLRVSELNGELTKVAAYQMTICNVKPLDYLLRKINDEEVPVVAEAKRALEALQESTEALMKLLTWRDFELLVELVFAQSGWRRTGETGGTQKTTDIELTLPSTGERAFVQIKSRTDQAQLDDYVQRFSRRDEIRMFYVYHSGPKALACIYPGVVLIGPSELSQMVLNAGLFDWLLTKAG